jgi:hypothetical protein
VPAIRAPTKAVLVQWWARAQDVEAFVKADPYVTNSLVTSWYGS